MNKDEILSAFMKAEPVVKEYEKLEDEYNSQYEKGQSFYAKSVNAPASLRFGAAIGVLVLLTYLWRATKFEATYLVFVLPVLAYYAVKCLYKYTPIALAYKKKVDDIVNDIDRIHQAMLLKSCEIKGFIPDLPDNYAYPYAVRCMNTYVENGRADSIKEMIEVYELELHRARLENTQSQILQEAEKQTYMIQNYCEGINPFSR